MAQINPNPYKDGDPLGPTGRITAIFDSFVSVNELIPALERAGYRGDDAAVFLGKEAEFKLDAQGVRRDIVGLKMFQNAVCDEEELFDQFKQALEHGGAVVAIKTGNDEERKKEVTQMLKQHQARKINYWGSWHYDKLG